MFDRIFFGYATFIDCCQRGELKRTELDDLIAAWHSSTSKRPLRECIGLTVEEYEQFALDSKFIEKIIDGNI